MILLLNDDETVMIFVFEKTAHVFEKKIGDK
jgi:hypothetical protein